MKRIFVQTKTFLQNWADMGLTDEHLRELECMLLENPESGAVVPHLSGGRKIRLGIKGRGKSGGVRVIYIDVVMREKIYLLFAYPKNVQTDLTPEQTKTLNKLIDILKGDQ